MHAEDFGNMAIAIVGTWRNFDIISEKGKSTVIPLPSGKYEAFVNNEKRRNGELYKLLLPFFELTKASDKVIGFNSRLFEDELIYRNITVPLKTDFDLLCELKLGKLGIRLSNADSIIKKRSLLHSLAKANGIEYRQCDTPTALLWQEGKHIEAINSCLDDLKIIKELYFLHSKGLINATELV